MALAKLFEIKTVRNFQSFTTIFWIFLPRSITPKIVENADPFCYKDICRVRSYLSPLSPLDSGFSLFILSPLLDIWNHKNNILK